MPHHQSRMLDAIRLPATTREHLGVVRYCKQALFIACFIAQAQSRGPEIRANSLRVSSSDQAMRNKRFGFDLSGYLSEH